MNIPVNPRPSKLLFMLSAILLSCGPLLCANYVGYRAPWTMLIWLSIGTVLKLAAAGSSILLIAFYADHVPAKRLPTADYEFTIPREGRPQTFSVVPDFGPQVDNAQKASVIVVLLFGTLLALWPEWAAIGPTYQFWTQEMGQTHPGTITELRTVLTSREPRRYVAYTYWLNGQTISRTQEISAPLYAQLARGQNVSVRYQPFATTHGYVVDPAQGLLFFEKLSLPMVWNAAGAVLAFFGLRALGPRAYQYWQRRRRAQTNEGIISP